MRACSSGAWRKSSSLISGCRLMSWLIESGHHQWTPMVWIRQQRIYRTTDDGRRGLPAEDQRPSGNKGRPNVRDRRLWPPAPAVAWACIVLSMSRAVASAEIAE